ncbi:adenosine deaminase [Rathayibacter caricis]|uniref:adenosine deaminase n=1 Tax=Rathayibacter caricis TaxID=110936 RepID=UPI001FB43260|nr:adenosine deaminase [Rathayibacter caricis]MCJ1697801.1 adenosine deaminase [Rathayibacter caricis]
MTPTDPRRDLALLPKAHLHVHLEAAVRHTTVAELATAAGQRAPQLPYRGDFAGFAELFLGMIRLLSLPDALDRVIREAAEDARDDGAVVLELGVSPQFYATAYGSDGAALATMAAAAVAATAATDVEVGLMVTLDRTLEPAVAERSARLAAAFVGRGVVSLGLANDEVGHPAAAFATAFAIGREAGLLLAPHAGELVGPSAVVEALDVVGADRIQHGIRAAADPAVLERLADERVCLDVCPTSNALLGVVSSLAEHPLPLLLDAGVACSINADDPTLFGSGLLDEYVVCREVLGLTDEQLAACARTSIEFSAATDRTRAAAIDGIARWLTPISRSSVETPFERIPS